MRPASHAEPVESDKTDGNRREYSKNRYLLKLPCLRNINVDNPLGQNTAKYICDMIGTAQLREIGSD